MAVVDVVTYQGSPEVFAWKFPNSELSTWTQLIVNESQEAILVKGGKICDIFQAGRHTLSTDNIPILNRIINLPFGGHSPFTAEVWYINKVFSLDIKWGTATPIQLQDPKYRIFVPVRAFGQFGIQIEDSQKFLIKLVGALPQFDKTSIIKYFRGVYLTKAKDCISSYLIHRSISILEINAYLNELSAFLQERISPAFVEFGIQLTSFFVNDINVPEDDPAVMQLKKALAKRAEMEIIGYSYQQERSFDTLEGAATNPGFIQEGLMGAGIGLGMGVGVGGAVGQQFGDLAQNLNTGATQVCPKCGMTFDKNARFCSRCGYDMQSQEKSKTQIRCASCGTVLNDNSKFCMKCGKKYNPCPTCKADLPDDAKICSVCGSSVPKQCPKCRNTLPANSNFCPECGYSTIKKCLKCGAIIEDAAKFCPQCGTPVSEG